MNACITCHPGKKEGDLLGTIVYEVPIRYYGRTYAEGKKITWRDGLAALGHIIRYRFMD